MVTQSHWLIWGKVVVQPRHLPKMTWMSFSYYRVVSDWSTVRLPYWLLTMDIFICHANKVNKNLAKNGENLMLLHKGLVEATKWYNENESSASHLGLLSHTHYEDAGWGNIFEMTDVHSSGGPVESTLRSREACYLLPPTNILNRTKLSFF